MNIGTINVIGAGSIGSFTTQLLAKVFDIPILVHDNDQIELHNAENQLYRVSDVKKQKVEVLKQLIQELNNSKITTSKEKVSGRTPLNGIVIAAVDSMTSRKEIWKAVRLNAHVPLYIDPRSGGDVALMYALDPRDLDQIKAYEKTLHDDESGAQAPCATRETVPTLWTIAVVIARIILSSREEFRAQYTKVILNLEGLPIITTEKEELR